MLLCPADSSKGVCRITFSLSGVLLRTAPWIRRVIAVTFFNTPCLFAILTNSFALYLQVFQSAAPWKTLWRCSTQVWSASSTIRPGPPSVTSTPPMTWPSSGSGPRNTRLWWRQVGCKGAGGMGRGEVIFLCEGLYSVLWRSFLVGMRALASGWIWLREHSRWCFVESGVYGFLRNVWVVTGNKNGLFRHIGWLWFRLRR